MFEFFQELFATNFMPHAVCLRARDLIWLHVVSDGLIALAYGLIPLGLLRIAKKRTDFSYHWMFLLFATFILSCGATHVLAIVTLWVPVYRFEGLIKAVTALASLSTALLLLGSVHAIVQLPALRQWREDHQSLEKEMSAREEAEKRNAFLAAIVSSSGDAILSKTLDGVITSWNGGAERLFGFSAQEAIGQNIRLIVPADKLEQESLALDHLRAGVPVQRLETIRLHKTGVPLPVNMTISPIRTPAPQVIGGVSIILQDNTELLRAQQKFRLMVESAPNAMVMIDGKGLINLINAQAEKFFGYNRAELIGEPVEILIPERFRGAHPQHRNRFFARVDGLSPAVHAMGAGRKLYGRRKDSTEFPMEVGLNPIQTEDGLMVLSAIADVTERERTEQKLNKFNEALEQQVVQRTAELAAVNQELEEFAYAASHDLKAPLRIIGNAMGWLKRDLAAQLGEQSLKTMTLVCSRVERMDKLLDALLEYARIGHLSDEGIREIVQGSALLDDVWALVSRDDFTLNVSPAFAGVRVHRMPLQQIFINLIGNAIKHHHRQTGSIDVTVEETDTLYCFAVKDDGPGIPAQYHEVVFQMFQTLRPKDKVEGSGLGLAMVRKHVEMAGGTMSLESREGEGSTFRFTWPKLCATQTNDAPVSAVLQLTKDS